jgi:hypothetical protein
MLTTVALDETSIPCEKHPSVKIETLQTTSYRLPPCEHRPKIGNVNTTTPQIRQEEMQCAFQSAAHVILRQIFTKSFVLNGCTET